MKKRILLVVMFIVIGITTKTQVKAATPSFKDQFSNIETAETIADYLGYSVDDEITQAIIDSTITIDITGEGLSNLEGIGIFTNLQNLYAGRNDLRELPSDFVNLASLKSLDIYFNLFKKFPNELLSLTNLIDLNLSKNMIIDMTVEQQIFLQSTTNYNIKNQSYSVMTYNSGNYVHEDYSLGDDLPILTQIQDYNNGTTISYFLINPEGDRDAVTTSIVNSKSVISGDNFPSEGRYSLEIVFENITDSRFLNDTIITKTFDVYELNPIALTMIGNDNIEVFVGDAFVDPGATAVDSKGTSRKVNTWSNLNMSEAGTYKIVYSSSTMTHSASVTRTVVVKERTMVGDSNKEGSNDTGNGNISASMKVAKSAPATGDTTGSTVIAYSLLLIASAGMILRNKKIK